MVVSRHRQPGVMDSMRDQGDPERSGVVFTEIAQRAPIRCGVSHYYMSKHEQLMFQTRI